MFDMQGMIFSLRSDFLTVYPVILKQKEFRLKN